MEDKNLLKDRDFKAEFDELLEDCSTLDVVYMTEELDRYGWANVYLINKKEAEDDNI